MRWCTSQSRHVFVKGFVQQLKRPLTWPRRLGEGINVAELSTEPDLDAREQATVVPLSVAENAAPRFILHSHQNLAPSGMRRQHPLLSCHCYSTRASAVGQTPSLTGWRRLSEPSEASKPCLSPSRWRLLLRGLSNKVCSERFFQRSNNRRQIR